MKVRPVRIVGDVAYVPLTKGYEAIIDAADVYLVGKQNWHAAVNARTVYALTNIRKPNGKWTTMKMHRLIAATPENLDTDHIDGNGLNNRRSNLRHATTAENMRNTGAQRSNTSGFKGVYWNKSCGKWQSSIAVNGKRHHLGLHDTAEMAFFVYGKAATDLHGEFSRTI